MKNNTTKLICAIVGGVVIVGAMVLALVHFWDDIKKLLPGGKAAESEDFADIDLIEE